MTASLSRAVSSSARITSCRHPFALQLMMPHGALASLRGRRKPPHDGMRRWAVQSVGRPLPLISGRGGGHYELTPPVVPVRTFFCRSRTRYHLACNFPAFSAAGSGNRSNRGAVLAPAELATFDPHPVQNHGQAPGDGDDGSTHPAFSRRHTGSSRTVSSSILCRTASCWRIDPADAEQRLGESRPAEEGPRRAGGFRASCRPPLTTPTFKPKLRSVPRKSDSTSSSLRCSSLRLACAVPGQPASSHAPA
jgi:hypothetical protein